MYLDAIGLKNIEKRFQILQESMKMLLLNHNSLNTLEKLILQSRAGFFEF